MKQALAQATSADAAYIAPRMSAADVVEVWAAGRLTPLQGLLRSMEMSIESWTWRVDGEPAAMFGYAVPSLLGEWANPWLLSTPLVRRHPFAFLRLYRAERDRVMAQFPKVVVMVDARHAVCLRWLSWMDFEVEPAVPYGAEGELFHKVTFERA